MLQSKEYQKRSFFMVRPVQFSNQADTPTYGKCLALCVLIPLLILLVEQRLNETLSSRRLLHLLQYKTAKEFPWLADSFALGLK
jgi:hypothetical protein